MIKDFWFIRHSESYGNVGGITKNTKENPLTVYGMELAEQLAKYLSFVRNPDLIVHSSYVRTIQTMKPLLLMKSHKNIPVEEWGVQEFTYLSESKYANTSMAQRMPAKEEFWKKNDPTFRDDDTAESVNDLILRAKDTIEKLISSSHNFIMIFTHGQFMKTIWLLLSNNGFNNSLTMPQLYNFFNAVEIPNTAILKVRMEDKNIWINTKLIFE